MKINILLSTILLWSSLVVADPAPVTEVATWEHSVSNGVMFGIEAKHLSELNLNHESFNFEYILVWGHESIWTNDIVAMNQFFSNLYSNNHTIMTIESDWANAFPRTHIALTGRGVRGYAKSQGIRPFIPPEEEPEVLTIMSVAEEKIPTRREIRKAKRIYRKMHPLCAACGSKSSIGNGNRIDIHHVDPVSEAPALAADTNNLIGLCRQHHYKIGHCGNWKWHNTNVRESALEVFRVITESSSCIRGDH